MLELNAKRQCRVRRSENIGYLPKFVEKRPINCGKKLTGSTGETLLVPIKNKVDAEILISMLEEHVVDFIYMHELEQQDNAPAHTEQLFKIPKRLHQKLYTSIPQRLQAVVKNCGYPTKY